MLEDDLHPIPESHEQHAGQGPFPNPRLFEEAREREVICVRKRGHMCGSFKSERENEFTGHNFVYIHGQHGEGLRRKRVNLEKGVTNALTSWVVCVDACSAFLLC